MARLCSFRCACVGIASLALVAGIAAVGHAEGNDDASPVITLTAGEEAADAPKKDDLVKIKAFMALDKLPAGGTCRVAMLVTVQEGWHINTNPANPATMIPTQFTVKSKLGTVLKEVKYPEGKKVAVKGLKEPQTIYEEQVLLYGVLQIPNVKPGESEELELQVKYQVCNDELCYPPKTAKVTGKIAVAAKSDPIKAINTKYFPSEK